MAFRMAPDGDRRYASPRMGFRASCFLGSSVPPARSVFGGLIFPPCSFPYCFRFCFFLSFFCVCACAVFAPLSPPRRACLLLGLKRQREMSEEHRHEL